MRRGPTPARSLSAVFLSLLVLSSTFAMSVPGTIGIVAAGDHAGIELGDLDGDGTAMTPYVVTNVSELQVIESDLSAHYRLGSDIDAGPTDGWNGGAGFDPIGDVASGFTGSFDGGGYSIANLMISRPGEDYVGLFGVVGGGTITNVTLSNVTVTGNGYVGGLAGQNSGTVSNAGTEGSVSGAGTQVGGLVGNNWGTISRSYSAANVASGGDYGGGGLVGFNDGIVSESYATGSVDSDHNAGGLIGTTWNQGTVEQSFATGHVTGTQYVGGVIGRNEASDTSALYWDTDSSGQAAGIGTGSGDATGLSTDEMTGTAAQTNMTGLDWANSWATTGTYPELQWNVDPAFFAVTISDTNSPITEGEQLVVNVTVENTGDAARTQELALVDSDFDGVVQDSVSVTLDGGERNDSIALVWATAAGTNGTGNIAVESENESATREVTVERASAPTFTSLDVQLQGPGGSSNINAVAFNWTIENAVDYLNFTVRGETGALIESARATSSSDVSGTLADGETSLAVPNTANVTLQIEAVGPGGAEFLSVSRVDQGNSPLNLSDFRVDDEAVEFENENFVVEISNVNATVAEGDTLTVEARVENIGFESGTQDINLTDFDGEQQDVATVSLGAGAVETIALTWETTEGDAGSGTLTVSTENDSVETPTVTVSAVGTFSANASTTVDSGTEDEPIVLDASASEGAIDRYEWDVDGDGNFEVNVTSDTVAFTYFDPGTYAVTLRTTNSTGGIDTDNRTITIVGTDDWPTAGGDTARTANNSDTDSPVTLEEKWRADIDGQLSDSAVVWNDTVYIADGNVLRAFDAENGAEVWTFDAGSRMEMTPTIADGVVYVATTSGDSTLYAVDAIDGTKAWETLLGGSLRSAPVVAAGQVYFTNGTHVIALDATDGSETWVAAVPGDVSSRHTPAYADGTLYLPGSDIVAFDVTTREAEWTYGLRTHARTAPILSNGTVYVGSNSPGVLALDATTGEQRWSLRKAPTATGTMAVADGYVYRMLPRGSLQAYHANNGTQAWTTRVGSFVPSGGIAVGQGVIYTTARTNGKAADRFDMTIVDADTGEIVSGLETPFKGPRETIRTPPVVSNGTVYVASRDLLALTGDIPPTARLTSHELDHPDPRIRLDGTKSSFDRGFENVTWNFGDGTTFTNESAAGLLVDHTFDGAGTYTVTMTVTDQNGLADSDSITVTVRARSVLVADAGNDTVVDEGEQTTFESLGVVEAGIDAIEWDFDGDGAVDETTTSANATHVYDTPGRYLLLMRVIDTEGNVGTDTVNVTVRDVTAPTAQFTVEVDDQRVAEADGEGATATVVIDEGTRVTFDATNSTDNVAVAGYEWDLTDSGAVDSTDPEPTFVYEDPGTYSVTVTVTDPNGNVATASVEVTVNDTTSPSASIAVDGVVDGEAEAGDVITLDGSSSTDNVGVTAWEWDFGDGNTSNGPVVNHSYASDGTYTIVLTTTDAAGNVALANVTVVVTNGTALVADAGPDWTIVRGVSDEGNISIELNASGSAPLDSITNYRWEFDGVVIADGSNEGTVVHEFEPPQTYPSNHTVTLEVTDGNGSATDTALVQVERDALLPVADASVNRAAFNTSEPIEFNASASLEGDGALSYAWDFGDGNTTTGEVVTHSYAAPGIFEVRLVVEDQAGNTDDAVVTVAVADATLPTAKIDANRTTVGIGAPVEFAGSNSTDNDEIESFEWSFGDGLVSRGETAIHSYATPGTFEATLTVVDASGNANASSVTVTVVDTVDPQADAGPDRASVVNRTVAFDGSNATDNVEVTAWEWDFSDDGVIDATGRTVTHAYGTNGTYVVNLTVSDGSGNQDSDTAIVTVEDGVGIDDESFELTNPTGSVLDVSFDATLPLDAINVTITDGDGIVVATLNGTDFGDPAGEYTYNATVDVSASGDGEYTATLETATDAWGNDGADGQSATATVDTTAPDVSGFTASNPDGQNVTISFTTDQVLDAIVVEIDGAETGTLTEVNFTEIDLGDGNYTYTATYESSSDGTYNVTLETVADATGNDGASGETDSIAVDTTAPTLFGLTASNPEGQNVTVTIETDEELATITVAVTGPENATLTADDFTETDDGDGNYTYAATYVGSTDGNYTVTVTTAADASGSDGATDQADNVVVDTTAPTISAFTVSNPAEQNVTISLTSDERLDAILMELDGPENATLTTDDFAEADDGDGNFTYAATYVGDSDGEYVATLQSAADAAGNDGATDNLANVTVDSITPAVSGFTVSNPDGRNVTISFEVDEELAAIAVNISDAESATLTVDDFTVTDDGNGTHVYTATYAGGSDGTYNATLETAADATGNDGATGQTDSVVIDTIAPTISGFVASNPDGQNVAVSFTTDEALDAITVNISGVESATLTEVDFAEIDLGDGNFTYDATYVGDTDGTYNFTLETATDVAGNDGASGERRSVTVDTTVPTVSAFSVSNLDGQNVTISLTSDERLGTIVVALDGPENATLTEVDFGEIDLGDGNYTYTATYESTTDGEYTATLQTAEDAASNGGTTGQSATVTVDTTAPTLSGVAVSNPDGQNVTITFGSDEPLDVIAVAVTGAETGTLTENDFTVTVDDGNYTYTATHEGSTDGNYTVTLTTATDASGNDGASNQTGSVTVGNLSVIARAEASSYVTGVGSTLELRANESTVPDGSTATYEWDVDDDGSIDYTGEVTTHTFASTGITNVSLTVTVNGISSTDTISITVRDETGPTVRLDADDTVEEGATLSLDASGSTDNVGITTFEWKFGDGSTASGGALTNPTHAYADPGHYRITVTASDAAGNAESNTTTVLVLGPETAVTTTALDFGNITNGSTNTSAVRVTNAGTAALNLTGSSITGQNASAFAVTGDAATSLPTVRPGETRSVQVAFSPTSTGAKTATLTLSTNDTDASTVTILLAGSGVEGDLRATPTQVSFGEVLTGDSQQATVAFETVGGADVGVLSATVVGPDASQFDIVDDGGLPTTVPDGGDHDITVAFGPVATGEQIASLQVETDDGSVVSVPLDGTGVGPDVHLSNDRIDFALIGKGDTAATSFDVSNYGTRSLDVINVSVTGADADQFSVRNAPTSIAVDGTETFDVFFSPDSAGSFDATLVIASNDSDEPASVVSLNGSAVGANVGIDKRTVNFGNVTQGQTIYMNITVRNEDNSKANLTVSKTPLVGANPESFEIARGGAPFTLSPGESHDLELAFTPFTAGTKQAQLQIISDAGNEPQIDIWLSNTRTYIIVQEVGGGSGDETPTVNVDGHNVVANGDLSINVSRPRTRAHDVGFDQLDSTFKPGGDFQIDVVHSSQPVGGDGVSYDQDGIDIVQYVRLNHTAPNPEATYDNTTVYYRVKKSALPNGTDPTDAALYRWNITDTRWNEMPTQYRGESSTHYFYVVDTPGFSQFVVTAPASTPSGTSASVGSSASSQSTSANFTVTSTAANRTDIATGESVGFEAVVTNDGNEPGTFTANLAVDGETVASQTVNLSAGKSGTVTFVHSFAEPGSYRVSISGVPVSTVTVSQPANADGPAGDTVRPTPRNDESSAGTDGDGASTGETVAPSGSAEDERAGSVGIGERLFGQSGDCELFGLNYGRFVVCWYWWVLLALLSIGAYVTNEFTKRKRDEDEVNPDELSAD